MTARSTLAPITEITWVVKSVSSGLKFLDGNDFKPLLLYRLLKCVGFRGAVGIVLDVEDSNLLDFRIFPESIFHSLGHLGTVNLFLTKKRNISGLSHPDTYVERYADFSAWAAVLRITARTAKTRRFIVPSSFVFNSNCSFYVCVAAPR